MTSWICACGPAGVPRAVVERLSGYARWALESAELIRSYQDLGATLRWTTPEQLLAFGVVAERGVAWRRTSLIVVSFAALVVGWLSP